MKPFKDLIKREGYRIMGVGIEVLGWLWGLSTGVLRFYICGLKIYKVRSSGSEDLHSLPIGSLVVPFGGFLIGF